ncbi:acetyltransferase [Rhizobium sp. R72]|uniref:GNAT family N-acetyltransferase n=1 Tax=unclassified Rhizobium TaxID=2613769 RepID=UPI000B536C3A|nr:MULTISPECIES: GNAT family N-acetyltransferase [unclassified Rhizobium]OWV92766.1 acetyltransferase [Rhizobium sp. R72]OWV92977.1 acetyltransferase [Rhizobium sp. R711]
MTTASIKSTVRIRPATSSDAAILGHFGALLVALHHEIDPARFIAASTNTPQGYAHFLARESNRPDAIVLVAQDESTILGYAYAALEGADYMSLRGPAGVIHDLFVDPARRCKGVGRLLLDAVVADMDRRGAERIVLSTAYGNEAAQRLFASMGFRPTMVEMTRG